MAVSETIAHTTDVNPYNTIPNENNPYFNTLILIMANIKADTNVNDQQKSNLYEKALNYVCTHHTVPLSDIIGEIKLYVVNMHKTLVKNRKIVDKYNCNLLHTAYITISKCDQDLVFKTQSPSTINSDLEGDAAYDERSNIYLTTIIKNTDRTYNAEYARYIGRFLRQQLLTTFTHRDSNYLTQVEAGLTIAKTPKNKHWLSNPAFVSITSSTMNGISRVLDAVDKAPSQTRSTSFVNLFHSSINPISATATTAAAAGLSAFFPPLLITIAGLVAVWSLSTLWAQVFKGGWLNRAQLDRKNNNALLPYWVKIKNTANKHPETCSWTNLTTKSSYMGALVRTYYKFIEFQVAVQPYNIMLTDLYLFLDLYNTTLTMTDDFSPYHLPFNCDYLNDAAASISKREYETLSAEQRALVKQAVPHLFRNSINNPGVICDKFRGSFTASMNITKAMRDIKAKDAIVAPAVVVLEPEVVVPEPEVVVPKMNHRDEHAFIEDYNTKMAQLNKLDTIWTGQRLRANAHINNNSVDPTISTKRHELTDQIEELKSIIAYNKLDLDRLVTRDIQVRDDSKLTKPNFENLFWQSYENNVKELDELYKIPVNDREASFNAHLATAEKKYADQHAIRLKFYHDATAKAHPYPTGYSHVGGKSRRIKQSNHKSKIRKFKNRTKRRKIKRTLKIR